MTVAPLVGAWIEIILIVMFGYLVLSLPSWERGLKCPEEVGIHCLLHVAPLVGAWIEICPTKSRRSPACCRSPRGSVD